VHHSHGVAIVDHRHNLAAQVGGGMLGVMALGDDPVEKLTAAAELHDVAVTGEVVHDLSPLTEHPPSCRGSQESVTALFVGNPKHKRVKEETCCASLKIPLTSEIIFTKWS